jgi:chorismate mutase/prephenate dehydratase
VSLAEIRQKIDALDERLLALLNERAELAHSVGVEKRAHDIEIYAPEREEQVLRALAEKNRALGGRLAEGAIRAIYREIMSASLALEKDLTIAFFGPEATETHQAARQKFGASVRYRPRATVAEVFTAVAAGEADYGVVPIASSLDGAVGDTLDMFVHSDLRVCAQVVVQVEDHLLGRIPRNEMQRVYVPARRMSSAQPWLQQNLPESELIEVPEAPRAAEMAAAERGAGAVGHKLAAEIYGLQVIAPSIQDSREQTARFLVLGPSGSPPTGRDRTAIMFGVRDAPGALYHALGPFHRRRLAMSKIESRPSRQHQFEYYFFADVDGHAADAELQAALSELEQHCTLVKILGTYPCPPKE